MPVWLQNEGAWIAIGVSVGFIVAGFVMHRVFVRILKAAPPPSKETDSHE
jgi:cytochrome b561